MRHCLVALACMLALSVAVCPSSVADRTWERVGGPPGGLGYDIRMDPSDPDRMLVTDAFAGLHVSFDGGLTWEPTNDGIEVRTGQSGDKIPVFSVTFDPTDPRIVWAGTQDVLGIYRSEDGGRTWEKKVNGIIEQQGISFRGFTVDPADSNVVYAAAEVSSFAWSNQEEKRGRQFDLTQGVVYRTSDGGEHWRVLWRGNNLARYVIVDPRDSRTIYISTGIFDREAADSDWRRNEPGGEGIHKSTDGGSTWSRVGADEGLRNPYVGSLVMHPENPDVLLAGVGCLSYSAYSGVYRSDDGGDTWRQVLATTGTQPITSVDFAPGSPHIAYAGGEHGFYRSDDGGVSWTKLNVGMHWGPPNARAGFPIDLVVDPRDGDRVFSNNYGGGNFLSEDGGRTWADASIGYTGSTVLDLALDPSDSEVLYATGHNGTHKSLDGGETWLPVGLFASDEAATMGAVVSIDPGDSMHVFMADSEGTARESHDGGASWTSVIDYVHVMERIWRSPTSSSYEYFQGVQHIAFAASDPQIAYAGFGITRCSTGEEIVACDVPPIASFLVSSDGGATWIERNADVLVGLTVTKVVVHPANPETVWIATAGEGVLRTTDGGNTWTAPVRSLRGRVVLALAIESNDPDTLYAGTAGSGVFVSNDGGLSWKPRSAGMDPNELIQDFAVDLTRPGTVYAASARSGVYMSEDGGETWHQISSGLTNRSVHALSISSDGRFLFAGTAGGGVFSSDLEAPAPEPESPAENDRDGDGVTDEEDLCPDFPGDPMMDGC